ncbi:hypothetical protein KFU94_70625 [Chloroflexi bacterium TSY]|nr:hypothetical protein [Chloroflexi bacterium TSY]
MVPTMAFISDPLKFQQRRGKIAEVTDPALFESARYMPVTRAFSPIQTQ